MGGEARRDRRRDGGRTALAVLAALVLGVAAISSAMAGPSGDPAREGQFGAPFVEPTIGTGADRVTTADRCVERTDRNGNKFLDCKPAGASLAMLPNGKNLFFDALAGTENIEFSIASEFGVVSINDQTRVIDTRRNPVSYQRPTPVDGGANGGPNEAEPVLPGNRTTEDANDGSLFCADLNFLPDGRVIATGGTAYYNDPGNDMLKFGATELQGIRNTRIFDPATNRWTQTGSMKFGRWYPTMVTLGDGSTFVGSGVRKLVRPVDQGRPERSNFTVRETETFDPSTGKWTENGPSAERSLPLFPRLHLLPNGHVLYNAGGQSFNPFGQSNDEALWNIAASYDPGTKRWTDLGVPGADTTTPGFRGSTHSVMLPLRKDASGRYTKAEFLVAGGVFGPPSPGGYLAVRSSRITAIDTTKGDAMTTRETGPLAPTSNPALGRWYSSGTLLPTGEVLATNGADRDEVASPSTEIPVKEAEIFDPQTETWTRLAAATRPRTYHNTAVLMPDARVLIGGHATISNSYTKNQTLPGGQTAPNDGRDPTFEIYSPPYLFRGPQPKVTSAEPSVRYGGTMKVVTDTDASQIESVVLVRNPSQTHVVDADQRNVELSIVGRRGRELTVERPPDGNVAPPGPYMLFANKRTSQGLIPSVSAQTFVNQVGAGAARLDRGPARCASRPFRAGVSGRNIERVDFSVDGRVVDSATRPTGGGRYETRIDPRRFGRGAHRLSARVTFVAASHTPQRTFGFRFARCAGRGGVARPAPRFTG